MPIGEPIRRAHLGITQRKGRFLFFLPRLQTLWQYPSGAPSWKSLMWNCLESNLGVLRCRVETTQWSQKNGLELKGRNAGTEEVT